MRVLDGRQRERPDRWKTVIRAGQTREGEKPSRMNVWEWCEDWYANRGYTPTETTDPTGPKAGSRRVVRGGSWCGTPEDCRSANRLGYAADGRLYTIGFRVCMSRP